MAGIFKTAKERFPLAVRERVVREDDLKEMAVALNIFFEKYGLSLRDVERLCGGAAVLSKSTLHRLVKADVERRRALAMVSVLREALRGFLQSKKLKAQQVEQELNALFPSTLTQLYCDTRIRVEGATWRERLDAFRRRRALNYHRLWIACGGVAVCSHKIVKQLCTGQPVVAHMEKKLKPVMRVNLINFLTSSGVAEDEAIAEIDQIFDEGDTMIAPRTTLPAEAQDFFRLRRDPFTSDPRSRAEVFTTSQLDRVASSVEDAINYQGFVVVMGEIGSGKTLLKKRVVETVEKSSGRLRLFFPAFFDMERVHAGSIVTYLLRKLEQPVPPDLVMRADKLRQSLALLSEQGVRVALAFDECHQLHDRLLSALKNFWELGSGGYDRFLGVVLFGQPQFEARLRDYRFREICERIDVVKMPSFEKHAWEYVEHRLKLAGGSADELFDRDAVKLLAKQASTPLALGNLCNAALLRAFNLDERKVTAALVKSDDDEPNVRAIRRA
jgi:type II secretory pathway predicted ATPase ExeA